MPSRAAFEQRPSTREAPSRSENSLCVCRWTKLFSLIRSSSPVRAGGRREAPPGHVQILLTVCGWNHNLVIQMALRLHSGRREGKPPGERMRLSYSSINTYETCPAKFRYKYQERLPTTTSPALAFGDSLHRALHRFHDRPVPVAPSLEELHEMLENEWVSEGFRDPEEEDVYQEHGR